MPHLYRAVVDIPHRLQRLTAGAYRPEIDGLRFFAIAIVLLGHLASRVEKFLARSSPPSQAEAGIFSFLTHPGAGVLLFFGISGFILAVQFLRQDRAPLSGPFLSRYFRRRILRIEPPYLLLLLATYTLIRVTGFQPPETARFAGPPASLADSLLASLGYVHVLLYENTPRLFGPGWSLEVEVQFYIFAPLCFFAYFRTRDAARRAVIGAVALAASIAVALLAPDDVGPVHLGRSLLVFFPYFWVGILMADFQGPIRAFAAGRRHWSWLGWAGLVGLCIVGPLQDMPEWRGLMMGVRLASVVAIFAAVFSAEHTPFRRFCSLPWISLIGGACYSLYLTHLQVMQVMSAVMFRIFQPDSWLVALGAALLVQIPVVLVVGLGFYALVERTFMIPNWPSVVMAGVRSRFGPAARAPLVPAAAAEGAAAAAERR